MTNDEMKKIIIQEVETLENKTILNFLLRMFLHRANNKEAWGE